MSENTSVSVYAHIQDPLKFVQEFGMSLARSQMFGCSNPEQGQVMAMACMCEGISPIEISRKYHIIKGKLEMRADAMLAAFRGIGGKHRIVQRDSEAAEVELTIDGQTNRFRFTWEEAQQEPFVYTKDSKGVKTFKDNWATPRGRMQMLWARVASDAVRCMAPEVNSGLYTPEEIRDAVLPNGLTGDGVATETLPAFVAMPGTVEAGGNTATVGQPEGEVIDAEYQVLPNAAATPETVVQPEIASPPAGQGNQGVTASDHAEVMLGDGYCTAAQAQAIRNLYVELLVPYEVQENILKRRNAQSLRNLTAKQAAEVIAALEAKRPPKS